MTTITIHTAPDCPSASAPLTSPPVNGVTPAAHNGELCDVLIDDSRRYTFRCVDRVERIWEGATSGLIYDDEPETGDPRWRFLRLSGSGADRTVGLREL